MSYGNFFYRIGLGKTKRLKIFWKVFSRKLANDVALHLEKVLAIFFGLQQQFLKPGFTTEYEQLWAMEKAHL